MMNRLEAFLRDNHILYETVIHPEAYTAQETAASMHVSGKELAKTVMVKAGGGFVMAVLPASRRLDIEKLKEVLAEKDVRIAEESEFKGLFPDCEPGAEPPFGNLYGVRTLVDRALAGDAHIFFNAGNHYEAAGIDYKDYEAAVKPRVADFSKLQ